MKEMSSHERFTRMFEHKEADRIPIIDTPWAASIERWQNEGMPASADYRDFFGLDKIVSIGADNSPKYPERVIEETAEYKVRTTRWGVTCRDWKHAASTPEFMEFTVIDRASWEKAKERMTPGRDRVNWDLLARNYRTWRKEGYWIQGGFWFGFDVTHSWMVGTERLLMALIEDPEWCMDMFNHYLNMDIALFDMVWEAGYKFDSIFWPDDMGYKLNQFFSVNTYRELLKPAHKRAIDWAHSKGIKAHMHSCGDIRPFIPEFIEMGLDAINPLEVKAGVDPVAVKKQFGEKIVLHGGVNAVLWDNLPQIEAEMRRVLPELKKGGGYIFSSDHSVPSSVSLEGFRRIVALARELGAY